MYVHRNLWFWSRLHTCHVASGKVFLFSLIFALLSYFHLNPTCSVGISYTKTVLPKYSRPPPGFQAIAPPPPSLTHSLPAETKELSPLTLLFQTNDSFCAPQHSPWTRGWILPFSLESQNFLLEQQWSQFLDTQQTSNLRCSFSDKSHFKGNLIKSKNSQHSLCVSLSHTESSFYFMSMYKCTLHV